jgi:hypothetical protein
VVWPTALRHCCCPLSHSQQPILMQNDWSCSCPSHTCSPFTVIHTNIYLHACMSVLYAFLYIYTRTYTYTRTYIYIYRYELIFTIIYMHPYLNATIYIHLHIHLIWRHSFTHMWHVYTHVIDSYLRALTKDLLRAAPAATATSWNDETRHKQHWVVSGI